MKPFPRQVSALILAVLLIAVAVTIIGVIPTGSSSRDSEASQGAVADEMGHIEAGAYYFTDGSEFERVQTLLAKADVDISIENGAALWFDKQRRKWMPVDDLGDVRSMLEDVPHRTLVEVSLGKVYTDEEAILADNITHLAKEFGFTRSVVTEACAEGIIVVKVVNGTK